MAKGSAGAPKILALAGALTDAAKFFPGAKQVRIVDIQIATGPGDDFLDKYANAALRYGRD
jgi:hypothetical protein